MVVILPNRASTIRMAIIKIILTLIKAMLTIESIPMRNRHWSRDQIKSNSLNSLIVTKYCYTIFIMDLLFYSKSGASSPNSATGDWEWNANTGQKESSADSKPAVRRVKEKKTREEPLISLESDKANSNNWNSKLEEDAWEILKD